MPVIECSCGMVMSIATDDSRCYCIRCGGLEFKVVSEVLSTPRRNWRKNAFALSAGSQAPLVLTGTCATVLESANEASHG